MKTRQELEQQFTDAPAELIEYASQLQEEVRQQRDQLAQQEQELRGQQQLLAEARAHIAELKRQLFGPKADKLIPEQEEQLRQVAGDLQEHAQRPPPVSQEVLQSELPPKDKETLKEQPRRRRHPLPAVQLEVQRLVLEPDNKVCGSCQKVGRQIGQEVTTEYEYRAARLICKETVRPKYAHECPCAPEPVSIAPLLPRPVPQSKLGLGLAVYILLSRFDDHIAYYTLERIFRERHGVIIPRQQMIQWVEKIAFLLLAIYNGIWEELQATSYLWFYSNPEGDVFLEFCTSRGRAGPEKRLTNFQGTMQTDAYAVYDSLRRQRHTSLKRLGCLAHIRRKWYKAAEESSAEAIWFIGQIRQLYLIEDETRDLSDAERKAMRRQKAPALWRAMKRRALELQANGRLLPQSSLGKAVNYFLNEYTAVVGYLRDGRYLIDNNLVENDVRPSVVGRKRWLFIGHPDAVGGVRLSTPSSRVAAVAASIHRNI